MKNKLIQLNEALPLILVIDLIYLVLGEAFILFLLPMLLNTTVVWQYMTGFFAGVIYAVIGVFHMSFGIRKVVYGHANQTKTYIIGYVIRILIMIVIFAVLYIFNIGDLVAAVIGMFAMKVSAYLQPFADGASSKNLKKEGE